MRQRFCIILSVLCSVGCATSVFALDQTSTNFQNKNSTFAPAVFDATSPNFVIKGSIDSIVGDSASPNFKNLSGIPMVEAVAIPSPAPGSGVGGGGGGVGGGGIPVPIFSFQGLTFKSEQMLAGTRYSGATMLVNGSSNGVTYADAIHWQRDIPLFLGLNDIRVQAQAGGNFSSIVGGTIERLLIGDVNRSRRVDDADLSLFSRAWKKYTFFADFNEDRVINDADLSLLASHWTASY